MGSRSTQEAFNKGKGIQQTGVDAANSAEQLGRQKNGGQAVSWPEGAGQAGTK